MPWLPSSASLEIHLADNDNPLFFLYPSTPEAGPIADTLIEGKVVLTLPSTKRIRTLQVLLIGVQRYIFRGREQSIEVLRRELAVSIEEGQLLAGKHEFAFTLSVPANVAPTLISELGTTLHRLYAIAPGCGLLGSELKAEKKIGLQVNQSAQKNGPPPAYSLVRNFIHDCFGPTRLELSTKALIIGGYIRFYIALTNIFARFQFENIVVELVQTLRTKPSMGVLSPVETTVQKRVVYDLQEDPEIHKQLMNPIPPSDRTLNVSCQARIPYGAGPFLCATTHANTATCLSFTHEAKLVIIYRQYETDQPDETRTSRQKLEISGPATISSCFCILEHSKLPLYEESISTEEAKATTSKWGSKFGSTDEADVICMCKQLEADEEKEYGIPREEVREAWRLGELGRNWASSLRHKPDGAAETGT